MPRMQLKFQCVRRENIMKRLRSKFREWGERVLGDNAPVASVQVAGNQDVSRSLNCIPAGMVCVVDEMAGGHAFKAHIIGMGITLGARITVLQNMGHGPVLVTVRDTRLALGRGEAEKIHVREA